MVNSVCSRRLCVSLIRGKIISLYRVGPGCDELYLRLCLQVVVVYVVFYCFIVLRRCFVTKVVFIF